MTEKPYIKSDRKSDFYRIVEITFLILFSIYVLYSAAAQVFPWEHLSFFEGRAKEFSTGFVEKSTGMSVEIPAQSKPELFSKGITIVGTLPDYINSHDYMRLYMAHQNVSVLIKLYDFFISVSERTWENLSCSLFCDLLPFACGEVL